VKKAIFKLKRDFREGRTTLGEMFDPEGDHFCFVLEDVVREHGIKIKKETAIPATDKDDCYFMGVRTSPKYGEVVVIYTRKEEDVYILEYGGVEFRYILCHGGNDHGDTEGCLLVNKNRDIKAMSAWGSMKTEILEKVKALQEDGFSVHLQIENAFLNELA